MQDSHTFRVHCTYGWEGNVLPGVTQRSHITEHGLIRSKVVGFTEDTRENTECNDSTVENLGIQAQELVALREIAILIMTIQNHSNLENRIAKSKEMSR